MSAKIIIFVVQNTKNNLIIMKRTVLVFSLLAIVSLHCTSLMGQINFGFKLGPNLGWAGSATTAGSGDGARMGLTTGIFVDKYFTDNLALSVGVNYNLVRMSYRFTDHRLPELALVESNIEVARKFKGSYLELPVKLKARFEVIESLSVYGEAGAGVGVNLSAKGKDTYDFYGSHYSDTDYKNYSYEYRLLQASLHFGLGAAYEISSRLAVFAQISYRHALSNMFTQTLYKETNSNLKYNFIGLEVGILL